MLVGVFEPELEPPIVVRDPRRSLLPCTEVDLERRRSFEPCLVDPLLPFVLFRLSPIVLFRAMDAALRP